VEISQKLLALSALYAFAVGIGLGALYDVFRICRAVRGNVRLNTLWIFVEDILYALLCAVVVIIFVFHVNQGRIRGFMLLAAGAGFRLYYVTLGRLMMGLAERIAAGIRWIFGQVSGLLLVPLRWLKRMVIGWLRKWYTRQLMRRMLRLAERGFS